MTALIPPLLPRQSAFQPILKIIAALRRRACEIPFIAVAVGIQRLVVVINLTFELICEAFRPHCHKKPFLLYKRTPRGPLKKRFRDRADPDYPARNRR